MFVACFVVVARFIAAAFSMVAERATLLRNKLRNKSLVCHQPNITFVCNTDCCLVDFLCIDVLSKSYATLYF